MSTPASPILAAAFCLAFAAPLPAETSLDETADSAVWLMKKSMLVHRDGRHRVMLRALWRLHDPKLQPLFAELSQRQHPELKVHGILGLAHVSEPRKLDLALLADLKDPLLQAQLVSAALDAELLDIEQCRQLIDWPGLEPPVKIIVAGKLVADGKLHDRSVLDKAEGSDRIAMKGMVALLKLQLGDQASLKTLQEIDRSEDPTRDEVRAMLLQTALRYELQAVAPWAMGIVTEPQDERGLIFLALRAAIKFGAPNAQQAWVERFGSTTDPADHIRLALLALELADRFEPAVFEKLTSDGDELVCQMGRTGRAIASGEPPDKELMKLLEMNHLIGSQWVLQYASRMPITEATAVLVGIILAAEGAPNPPQFRRQRLENCVFATQQLLEKDPSTHPVVTSLIKSAPELTQEAILMGLIRAEIDAPHNVIEGIDFASDTGDAMALLLRARGGAQLSEAETQQLGQIVRGGAGLEEPLRLQAAWVYLKLTQQDQFALANALGE